MEIPQIYNWGLSGRNPQHFGVKRIASRVMVVILQHILAFSSLVMIGVFF